MESRGQTSSPLATHVEESWHGILILQPAMNKSVVHLPKSVPGQAGHHCPFLKLWRSREEKVHKHTSEQECWADGKTDEQRAPKRRSTCSESANVFMDFYSRTTVMLRSCSLGMGSGAMGVREKAGDKALDLAGPNSFSVPQFAHPVRWRSS